MKAAILVDSRTGTSTSLGMAATLCYCSDIALVILRPELHQKLVKADTRASKISPK